MSMWRLLFVLVLLACPVTVGAQANYPASLSKPVSEPVSESRHIREEFLGEACSDFSVLSRDSTGDIKEQTLLDAAVVKAEVVAKEDSPDLVTIHAVVNEKPERTMLSTLRQLASINKLEHSRVGSVYVVTDKNPFEFLDVYTGEKLKDILLSLSENNTSFSMRPTLKVPSRYAVKHSPTWIIEHKGVEHIFEGNYSLNTLLDGQGRFHRERHE